MFGIAVGIALCWFVVLLVTMALIIFDIATVTLMIGYGSILISLSILLSVILYLTFKYDFFLNPPKR